MAEGVSKWNPLYHAVAGKRDGRIYWEFGQARRDAQSMAQIEVEIDALLDDYRGNSSIRVVLTVEVEDAD
jgi:hypothetical protein